MTTPHPFRFGVVTATARSGQAWLDNARQIESLGYSTLLIPDGLRYTLSPMPALAAAAAVTRTLRVGTYVIANDYRHPLMLAKEAAALDFLSNGRFELGIGAGRPDAAADNRMLGQSFDAGSVRVARLAESLALIKTALQDQPTSFKGAYYTSAEADISPRAVQQPRPPLLVAAAGRQMLALAAREADIVALAVPPTATEAEVAQRIDLLRQAAGHRFAHLELNLNLMAVGEQVPRWISGRLKLSASALAEAGAASALTGSLDEMCESLDRRRERLGISYVVVSDELMHAFGPVVARLSST